MDNIKGVKSLYGLTSFMFKSAFDESKSKIVHFFGALMHIHFVITDL